MKESKKILSKIYMVLILAFFYLPILYMIIFIMFMMKTRMLSSQEHI